MGVFQNNLMGAAAAAASAGGGDFYDHQISQSVRLGDSGYLKRTPSGAGNRATWTFSTWIKLSVLGINTNSTEPGGILNAGASGNQSGFYRLNYSVTKLFSSSAEANFFFSTGVYRDTSAWQHIVWTQGGGTATVYVNGVAAPGATASVSGDTAVNNSVQHGIGGASNSLGESPLKAYLAETIMIDGTALGPDSFGEEKNGVWIPKDASGLTFGTNGFHLDYASSGDLGNDVSGNNNDWTPVNLAAHDQMLDSPTFNSDSNGGNFNTLNAVDLQTADTSLTEGNLTLTTTAGQRSAFGTMGVSTGKWYFESRQINDTSSNGYPLGIQRISEGLQWKNWTHYIGSAVSTYDYSYAMYNKGAGDTSEKVYNDVWTTLTTSSAGVAGTIFQMAFDLDAGKIWFGINNTWTNSGNPSTAANPVFTSLAAGTYATALSISLSGSHDYFTHNYGQDGTFAGTVTAQGNSDGTGYGNFYYAPPTDFLALCSGNLPTADAVDPAQTDANYPQKLFNTKLYTGTGSSNALTGVGFQPDWTWVKERGGTNDYKLTDSTRGVTKSIESNTDVAEATDSNGLTAFGADGFTVGSDAVYNNSSDTYLGWNWRANGGSLTTNNVGDQTSYTQTDPSGAFSIVKYAGTGSSMTVGHGLSVEPKLTIIKDLTATQDWVVYTKIIDGSMDYFILNSGAAKGDSGLTGPNSSVWTWNSGSGFSNTASRDYIMYNFANIEGYCKTGIYTGNASTAGVFVNTGFRPAWLMIKRANGVESWFVMDDKRDTYNVVEGVMQLNGGNPESTADYDVGDFLSNGFKLRISGVGFNGAEQYIYMAFAENPFKYATAR